MTRTNLADRIRLERRSGFVGREAELARLAGAFEERGPVMTLVVGLGGMGKSSLLDAFAERLAPQVHDGRVRRLLEASSLVRRATRSGLSALVPEQFGEEAFAALQALPFVEIAADGLVVHETVRAAIAASLRALDPERHQALRRAAWTCLRAEVAGAARAQRWRYMADLLYLVDRPEVREAFFPSEGEVHGVEAARPSDGPAILALARAFDQGGAAGVEAWWAALPNAFHVVRAPSGGILAFHAFALAAQADAALGAKDPQTNRWLAHLRAGGISADSQVFFNLRVLAAGGGEAASPAAVACWLDAKRFYLEHPDAQRIYVGMAEPEAPLGVLGALGFSAPESLGPGVGGVGIGTILLDFGSGGVLGWLAGLVDAQFGNPKSPFDVAARALRTATGTVPLTKLEFGVTEYLDAHTGRVVTRDELLQNVWEQSFGGSNVVDAVVKILRKKLGPLGSALKTVIGHGYRFSGFPRRRLIQMSK